MFEIRVSRAVGEIFSDVDVDCVRAAVNGIITIDFNLVSITRDFEEERLADAMAEGEREVFGDLSLRRFSTGPEIGGRLRGDFETDSASEGVVVAAGWNFETINHGLSGVAYAGAGNGFAANEIAVGCSAVACCAFGAEDIGEIKHVARAKSSGIVNPERSELRIGVIGTVAYTRSC